MADNPNSTTSSELHVRVASTGKVVLGPIDLGLAAADRDATVVVTVLPATGSLFLDAADGTTTAVAAGTAISIDALDAGWLIFQPDSASASASAVPAAFFAVTAGGSTHSSTRLVDFDVFTQTVSTKAGSVSGAGTLTVSRTGALVNTGTAASWTGVLTGATIDNAGTVQTTGADARAINGAGDAATAFTLDIENRAGAVIQATNDAVRVNRDFTTGSLQLHNAGLIFASATGQAIDFDTVASTVAGQVRIVNDATGVIRAANADAIRPGQNATVVNAGLIWAGGNDKNDGVDFQTHSGSVDNQAGGLISGQRHGITTGGYVSVVNEVGGTIIGRGGSGVGSDGTGTVVNHGTIIGAFTGTGSGDGDGVDIDGYGEVDNYGLISASGSVGADKNGQTNWSEGVALTAGGYFYNHLGGVVHSSNFSVAAFGGVTVTNDGELDNTIYADGLTLTNSATGVIRADAGAAFLSLYTGGNTVTNAGLISSHDGMYFHGPQSNLLTNSGTIVGTSGTAVTFGSGDDTLAVHAGSIITGQVIGGDGTDTIALEDGATFASPATGFEQLTVAGSATLGGSIGFNHAVLADSAALLVAQGAIVTLGNVTAGVGSSLAVNGTLLIASGQLNATLTGTGVLAKTGADALTVMADDNAFTGTVTITAGTLVLDAAASLAGATIDLGHGAGKLVLAAGSAGAATLSGLGTDDLVVLQGFDSGTALLSVVGAHVLVKDASGTAVAFVIRGLADGLTLALVTDISGGAVDLIAVVPPAASEPPTTSEPLAMPDPSIPAVALPAQDFNGDGTADLLLSNPAGGFTTAALNDTGVHLTSSTLALPGWTTLATLDFTGDGRSDVLLRKANGTFAIWAGNADGSFTRAYIDGSVSTAWQVATTGDFDGDGKTDILWRNAAGAMTEWQSTGTGFHANVFYTGSMSRDWALVGTGDFDGDGRQDIVWRNALTGTFTIWAGTDTGFDRNVYTNASVSTAWQIAGIGDFDGDGKDDLLWRLNSGDLAEWRSTGTGFTANVYNAHGPTSDWTVAGVDDLNGDGKADLLWRNGRTGEVTSWNAADTSFEPTNLSAATNPHLALIAPTVTHTIAGASYPQQDFNGDGWGDLLWHNDDGTVTTWDVFGAGTVANTFYDHSLGTSWTEGGSLDFNGDGLSDLIWRKDDGTFTIWERNAAGGFQHDSYIDTTVSADWTLAAIGDFNGDGKDDLVWRNVTTGVVTQWRSTGSGFIANVSWDSGVPLGTKLLGAGDFNGDGKADLLWQDATTGDISAWKSVSGGFDRGFFQVVQPGADWTVVGIGDFDHDGRDDLVVRNGSGDVQVWRATGSDFVAQPLLSGHLDDGWQIAQVNDFNNDGRADLVVRNTATGAFETWQTGDHGFDLHIIQVQTVNADWHLLATDFGL